VELGRSARLYLSCRLFESKSSRFSASSQNVPFREFDNVGRAKDIAAEWFEEVWNRRNDDAIFRLAAKPAIGYLESGVVFFDICAFKEFRDHVLAAMPDLKIEVENILEQDEETVVRWFLRGTHTGDGFGFAPTHSRIKIRGMTWLRISGNKIVEGWDCWNQARMMQMMVGMNPMGPEDKPLPPTTEDKTN